MHARALRCHHPIWYIWDPLVLIAYGREAMDIAQSFVFPTFEYESQDTIHIAITIISIIEILLNFVRANEKDDTLRTVIQKYLSFLFWWDVIAIFNLEQYLFLLIFIKFVRIR